MTDNAEATLPAESTSTTDVAGWEDPPRRLPGTGDLVLSVDGFEGPLDWLLEMVRAHRIDLARLSILALVEAFTAALEAGLAQRDTREVAPLWRWGDWLVMAANLALLRSRLLLPVDSGEAVAAHDEAEAIRRQLLDRLQMAAAVDWLEQRPQLGQAVFARGAPEARGASRVGDLTDLLRGCLVALKLPEDSTTYQPPLPVLWRVAQATSRIQALLAATPAERTLADFLPKIAVDTSERDLHCRAALASTLVAGLELAREGALSLHQAQAFSEVMFAGVAGRHDATAAPVLG